MLRKRNFFSNAQRLEIIVSQPINYIKKTSKHMYTFTIFMQIIQSRMYKYEKLHKMYCKILILLLL